MGEAVSLDTRKTIGNYGQTVIPKIVEDTNKQSTGNPDVNIARNSLINPPNVFLIQTDNNIEKLATTAVAKAEAIKPVKPEYVVNISNNFKTSFIDLEEETVQAYNQLIVFTRELKDAGAFLLPPLKFMMEKEQTIESYITLGETMNSKPEIQEAHKYVKENGLHKEGQPMPVWYSEKIEQLAKKFVFFYSSHEKLEDSGMDMDYLTIPSLEHVIITDEQILKVGYSNTDFVIMLSKYDMLLSEYSGVGTVGTLGRQLNIKGVELYNLWKALIKEGVVTDYTWKKTDDSGKVIDKNIHKWLEIKPNTDLKALVAKLGLLPNIAKKLENYLLTLSKGNKADSNFIKKYEELKSDYANNVLNDNYLLKGFEVFTALGMENDQKNYDKFFVPKADEWVKEYNKFEETSIGMIERFQVENKEDMSLRIFFIEHYLKRIKSDFQDKNIPVGQEFLFRLLEENDNLPQEKKSAAAYEIKYK